MKLSNKSKLLMAAVLVVGMIEAPMSNFNTLNVSLALEQAAAGNAGQMLRHLLICFAMLFLGPAQSLLWNWLRQRLFVREWVALKDSLLQNLLGRPSRQFRRENDAYYLNLFNTDTEVYLTYISCILLLCNWSAVILSSSLFLFHINPLLLWTALISAGIPFLFNKPFENMTKKAQENRSQKGEIYNGILKETLEGYEAIRADNHPKSALERFHAVTLAFHNARAKYSMANMISQQFFFGVAGLSHVVCTAVGGWLIIQGQMSPAMMIAAQMYFVNLANAIGNVQEYIVEIRASRVIRDKLTKEVNEPVDVSAATCDPNTPATVDYEGLSFSFGERQLYDELSCSFAPGGCYAIVGESGSGKSTLTKLLLKYYDDYRGKITLSGQDIRDLSEEEIYKVVGLVSQNPFLFNASLYENITMFTGDPGEDSEEYRQLLADLNLTALAERVGDSPLGDFGDNISGGERQRINIARALRSHPSILIFDEPTTGLDPENVALIEKFIFEHEGVTRIVITHNWAEDYLSRFDSVLRIGAPAAAPVSVAAPA